MARTLFTPAPPPADLLDPAERLSRDALTALQLERLKATLTRTYAAVAPFRAKCEAAGVHPDDLKDLADLARFPFTTKADLRTHYPFGLFAIPREQVVRIHASSGTTGKPTVVGYSRADLEVWSECVARSIRASGGRPGDIIHVAYGYGLFTGGLGAHYGAERLGCTVVPISGGQTQRQVQLIQDFQPRIIMVTPSYMLNILEEAARQGLHPEDLPLEIGIFGAEPWTEQIRSAIETLGGMHAVDIYGLSEVMGPGVANECIETKDGLHLWEDHFYPEIVDPETGAPLPDGQRGELVLTSLTKEALPIIRYRTRDLTTLRPGTARNFRRIDKITGRSDDMLIIRGVNLFPTQIEELVCRDRRLAPTYLLEVTREQNLDQVTTIVELSSSLSWDDSLREAVARDLSQSIKDLIGISAHVDVRDPGSLPKSEGKARRVIDRRSL